MNNYLFYLLTFIAFGAYAQESERDTMNNHEIQEVTIVGKRSNSIPGSGYYLSSRKLEKFNQYDAQNVLRILPGVNVRDEEGFGLRPNIGLRGTAVNRTEKVTVMEDGILIAPAPYADPSAYYFPTFIRMSGIEVLKGSSQIKYGPRTVGGAINLLSTPIPGTFKGFAQLSYGSFNTNQQRLWVGDSRDNFDYVFEVTRFASDGFKEIDGGGKSGFDRRDFMGKLRWHTTPDSKVYQAVTLKFVNSTENGNETYLGLTYDDYQKNPRRRYAGTQLDVLDMFHHHVSLNHVILPAKGLSINTTAYYAKTFREWARGNSFGGQSINNILNDPIGLITAYNVLTGVADGNIDYRATNRTYFSQGLQINANYSFTTNQLNHKLHFGVRHHHDQSDRFGTNANYNMTNGKMILIAGGVKGNAENQIRNATATAAYFTYDLEYKGLKLSPGFRYEKIDLDFENFGTTDGERLGSKLLTASNNLSILLPGIGINYEFNNTSIVFGGVHKGFSPPGMPSVSSTSGQAIPESSINYELGYRHISDGLNFQATGFFNDFDNILGSDNVSGGGLGTGDMFNAGRAKIQGLEFSMEYDILYKKGTSDNLKLPVSLAYTYTSATFQETFTNGGGDWGGGLINEQDFIPFVSPHLLTAVIGLETSKFNVSVTGRYTDETRVKPGKGDTNLPASHISLSNINALPGFLILDFSANYKLTKKITLFSFINNLTNNSAIVANLPQGYRPAMPLSFNVGLKADF
ncbi:MAG: TonB-dependent receptor [Saprospiraceae bacterium]|nr:TonB-dependent receptor [Saprospiraceae bacterium]